MVTFYSKIQEIKPTKNFECFFSNIGTNNTKLIMRHYRKSDQSQSLAVLVAVNVRVTTMYQRTAPSQSDVSVNTLLMIILRWYHISVQKDVHVKNSEVLTLVAVENQLMLTRLVKCAIVFNLGS